MGFDGTGKDGADYTTCYVKLRLKDGSRRTLRLRGAFLTDGKTAAQETAALKDYCLGHGRNLLEQWRLNSTQMFPGEKYTIPAVAGLSPSTACAIGALSRAAARRRGRWWSSCGRASL